jgi:hypothetical protein
MKKLSFVLSVLLGVLFFGYFAYAGISNPTASSGGQTPWTSNIDGAGYNLTGVDDFTATGTVSLGSSGNTTTIQGILFATQDIVGNGVTFDTGFGGSLVVGGSATTTLYGDGTDNTFGGNVVIDAGLTFQMNGAGGASNIGYEAAANRISIYLENATSTFNIAASAGDATFDFNSLTESHTYTFPDATGTIALTSDIATTTLNKQWIFPGGAYPSSDASIEFVEANKIWTAPFTIPASIVVNKVIFEVTAAEAGATTSIAVFNHDASTRLFTTGPVSLASTGAKIVTLASPYTLTPGTYVLASTANGDGTTGRVRHAAFGGTATTQNLILNAVTKRIGYASASSTNGEIPASLGTIGDVINAGVQYPIVIFSTE